MAIFHTLEYISTNDERKKAAMRCLQLWDEINALWNDINYIEKHGTLPPTKMVTKEEKSDIKELDRAKLFELIHNSLRPGKSRYKRLMEQAKTGERKAHYENLFNQYQLQLTEAENRLKEL